MPLGYCMACHTLRTIVKIGLKLGSRECEWAPIEHDAPTRVCPASGSSPNFSYFDDVERRHYVGCSFCDREWPQDELTDGDLPEHLVLEHCPGSGRPIR